MRLTIWGCVQDPSFPTTTSESELPSPIRHDQQQVLHACCAASHQTARYGPLWHVRYVKRRTKQDFRTHQHEADAQVVEGFLTAAKGELEVVKRQCLVYQMYARKHKSIMVRHSPMCRLPLPKQQPCKRV